LIFLYFLLFLLGVSLVYLVLSLLAGRPLFGRGFPKEKNRKREKTGSKKWRNRVKDGNPENPGSGTPKTCPICGSSLEKGQMVKSFVFHGGVRSGNITEKMSHIFGCPFCYPANDANPRLCPVCKKIIPADGYLIARMFERPDRDRKHVHVLGCTACRNR
jgi:hypothetical protein